MPGSRDFAVHDRIELYTKSVAIGRLLEIGGSGRDAGSGLLGLTLADMVASCVRGGQPDVSNRTSCSKPSMPNVSPWALHRA